MNRKEWNEVPWHGLVAFVVGAVFFFVLILLSEPGFVFGVDHANLLFHEAGHVLIGLLSERLEIYGGTLGQLVFPVLLAVYFWRKDQTLSFAGAVVWFFENWLNVSRYMTDARALELPLLGGGEHDWNTIFSRWGVLQYDVHIATTVKALGWIGMLSTCVWVIWRAWQDSKSHSKR